MPRASAAVIRLTDLCGNKARARDLRLFRQRPAAEELIADAGGNAMIGHRSRSTGRPESILRNIASMEESTQLTCTPIQSWNETVTGVIAGFLLTSPANKESLAASHVDQLSSLSPSGHATCTQCWYRNSYLLVSVHNVRGTS